MGICTRNGSRCLDDCEVLAFRVHTLVGDCRFRFRFFKALPSAYTSHMYNDRLVMVSGE